MTISIYEAKKRGKEDYKRYQSSYAGIAIAGHLITRGGFGDKGDNIDTITNIFKIAFKKLIRHTGIIMNGKLLNFEDFFKSSEN